MHLHQVISELKRELQVREDVYPKWIRSGRLTAQTAKHRIDAIKRAIELVELHHATPGPSLFDE